MAPLQCLFAFVAASLEFDFKICLLCVRLILSFDQLTKIENDHNGRRTKWKMPKMEDPPATPVQPTTSRQRSKLMEIHPSKRIRLCPKK